MSKGKTVLCICKHCGKKFVVDTRHSYASCCGDVDCRRKASCEYSRRHYYMLKKKNKAAFDAMLARKKEERMRRMATRSLRDDSSGSSSPAMPQMRPVSVRLLYVTMTMFFSFLAGTQSPEEMSECIIKHLERASLSFDSPTFQREIGAFLMFVQAQFPHFGQRPGKDAPPIG